MTPFRGGAVEMVTRRHSTEATGGAPMRRWFLARGGEIGVRVVQWIMGVLLSRLLYDRRAVEGRRSRGGRQQRWNFNGTNYGR
jgi:hypothetical protein